MRKGLLITALVLPITILFGWLMLLISQMNSGYEVKVAVMGYDPRDLLSGHYIQYQIDWEKTDCSQFESGECDQEAFCRDAFWGRQCRYYIPEEYASELDKMFRSRNESGDVFEVIYSYQQGRKPMAKDMLINGKPWRESLSQNEEKAQK